MTESNDPIESQRYGASEKLDAEGAGVTSDGDRKKRLLQIAKWIIALVVVVGLVLAGRSAVGQWRTEDNKIQTQIADLDAQLLTVDNETDRGDLVAQQRLLLESRPTLGNLDWIRILLACLIYGVGLFVPGMVLHSALRSLGENPRIQTSVAAQLIGHAGKYVPGKAMVIILRAGGLAIDNVKPVRATVGVFMETLLMMGVGATVAGVIVFWLPIPDWMKWSAVCMIVCAGTPTLPPILKFVASKVAKIEGASVEAGNQSISSLRFFVTGWAWSILSWLIIGVSFTLLVSAIPSSEPLDSFGMLFTVSTAAIALAMVVGFASLLPGGAGVRELVLTTVLMTSLGPVQALLSAIAARLMFIVVEAICAAGAWLWLNKQRSGVVLSHESSEMQQSSVRQ